MNNENLELAITQYLDIDKSALNPFFGNCKDLEPFGDNDLAKVINTGDINLIDEKLKEINFSFISSSDNVNFGLFNSKPKYQSKGNQYFDLMVSLLNKLDNVGKGGNGAGLFKKIVDYILTKLQNQKDLPKLPSSLKANKISEKEWENVVHLLLS